MNQEAKNLALTAVDLAFQAHVQSLYGPLKEGIRTKDQDALDHAMNGVALGARTWQAMRDAITNSGDGNASG